MAGENKREHAVSKLSAFCEALVRDGNIRSMEEIFDRSLRIELAGKHMRGVLSSIQFPNNGSSDLLEISAAIKAWDDAVQS